MDENKVYVGNVCMYKYTVKEWRRWSKCVCVCSAAFKQQQQAAFTFSYTFDEHGTTMTIDARVKSEAWVYCVWRVFSEFCCRRKHAVLRSKYQFRNKSLLGHIVCCVHQLKKCSGYCLCVIWKRKQILYWISLHFEPLGVWFGHF